MCDQGRRPDEARRREPPAPCVDPETADGGGLPSAADRPGVTDPQHWLDLCA